jgi:lipoprotein-anchoring transpeptidase ErfK/SrfK
VGTLIASVPQPHLQAAGARIEVDLTRQVLLYIQDNVVVKTLTCSSGRPGWRTPTGHYAVYRKIPAWRRSRLGLLYKPAYIVGGIAIHGAPSVPSYPASHGCIRVRISDMDILYPQLPLGLTVDVYYQD